MYAIRSPGANAVTAAVVDVHPVRRRRREFAPVERGDRPRAMTDHVCACGGRFAGEVPGVEFLEGGVDVVEVEHDDAPRSARRR